MQTFITGYMTLSELSRLQNVCETVNQHKILICIFLTMKIINKGIALTS